MKKISILVLSLVLVLGLTACQEATADTDVTTDDIEEKEPYTETSTTEDSTDAMYWYWDYNVTWDTCVINGETFENVQFIWTNLGQTIIEEDGTATYLSDMVIEECTGTIEKVYYGYEDYPTDDVMD